MKQRIPNAELIIIEGTGHTQLIYKFLDILNPLTQVFIMKHQRGTCLLFVCLLFLTFSFVARQETAAQSNQLILEKEQHWETYGVGGTCIAGSHNLFVADVDGDGVIEIITGGSMYWIENSTQTAREAPLKIWNWNGQNLTLEKSQNWAGNIGCVHAGDANGDGIIEIITAGSVRNSTGSYSQIRIWQWNGEALILKASYEGIAVSSVSVSNVYKDGTPEIFTVGRFYNGTQFCARLCAWRWDGNSLTLKKSVEWGAANSTNANSVYIDDLDGDDVKEIVTGGYANTLKNSSGQLRIWHWNGEDFSPIANEEWRLKDSGYGLTNAGGVMGNTIVSNVKVGDVDGDGSPEIITGGFAYDDEKVNAQLRIWNWNGQALTLEKSQEWTTQDIAQVVGLSINDFDGDGRKEIVTSGFSAASGSFYSGVPEMAQLRVWSWDGKTLTLKNGQDWFIDNGAAAYHVASGDVDKDGVTEIVTVGCTYFSNMCDPDMRIWSIPNETSSPPYVLLGAVGIVAVIAVAVVFFLVRKKR
jgi:hypothetical protein